MLSSGRNEGVAGSSLSTSWSVRQRNVEASLHSTLASKVNWFHREKLSLPAPLSSNYKLPLGFALSVDFKTFAIAKVAMLLIYSTCGAHGRTEVIPVRSTVPKSFESIALQGCRGTSWAKGNRHCLTSSRLLDTAPPPRHRGAEQTSDGYLKARCKS